MRANPRIWFSIAAMSMACVAFINCSSGDGDANTLVQIQPNGDAAVADGSAGIDMAAATALVRLYAAGLKAQASRCEPAGAAQLIDRNFDQEEFLARITAKGTTDAMRIAFRACAGTIETAPCGGTTPECFALDNLTGTLAIDAPCAHDKQCASGVCTATETSCGVCVEGLSEDDNCKDGGRTLCRAGLGCNVLPGNIMKCQKNTLALEGEACGRASISCSSGLNCDYDASGAGFCRKPVAPGGTCYSAAAGLSTCDNGGSYTCSLSSNKCVLRAKTGESCDSGQPRASCVSGLVCDDTSQKCRTAREDIAVGQVCQTGDLCVSGASCANVNIAAGVVSCETDLQQGASCAGDTAVCAKGLRCDKASKTCQKRIVGADCL